jgi:uncharacterized protein YdeI (YjbR/CyaY-like superfamily)
LINGRPASGTAGDGLRVGGRLGTLAGGAPRGLARRLGEDRQARQRRRDGQLPGAETALCYGWIDGLRQKVDDVSFRQRVTSCARRSKWSKINCEKAEALLAAGRMRPAGQREVERAKADGRWDAAYDGQRTIEVPDDLARALRGNAAAQEAFDGLDSRNRYAVLFRIHDAKRPETRARRIEQFVTMLEEGRRLH